MFFIAASSGKTAYTHLEEHEGEWSLDLHTSQYAGRTEHNLLVRACTQHESDHLFDAC